MRFVLTGRAVIDGAFVERRDIVRNMTAIGSRVVDSFSEGADVLVASRTDTTKAAQARALGKPVWTYAQLYEFWDLRTRGFSESAARQNMAVVAPDRIRGQLRADAPRSIQMRTLPGGASLPSSPDAVVAKMPKAEPHEAPHVLSNGRRFIDL